MPDNQNRAKLNIVDRAVYDSLPYIGASDLFIIQEPVSDAKQLFTFAIGRGVQSDLYDLTGQVANLDFHDYTHNYNIPEQFQIPNKLWLFREENGDKYVYHVVMWSPDTNHFLDCFGEPNNLVIVDTLPQTGVTNYAYILMGENQCTLYVYDGTSYRIIGDVLRPDNVTIKFNSQGDIMGVGAFGMDATVGGTTYSAQPGSELFNYIEGGTANNISTGKSSSAHGANNIVTGNYSESHNIGTPTGISTKVKQQTGYDQWTEYTKTINELIPEPSSYSGTGIVEGTANNVFGVCNSTSYNSYCSFIAGAYNYIINNTAFYTILGYNNRTRSAPLGIQKWAKYVTMIGNGNASYLTVDSSDATMIGKDNTVAGPYTNDAVIIGNGNAIGYVDSDISYQTDSIQNCYVFGKDCNVYGQASNCFVLGYSNTIEVALNSNLVDNTYLIGSHLSSNYGNTFVVGRYNPANMDEALAPNGGQQTGRDIAYDGAFVVATGSNSSRKGTGLVVRDTAQGGEGINTVACQRGHTYSGNFTAWDGTCLSGYSFTVSPVSSVDQSVITQPVFNFYPENSSEYTFTSPIKSIKLRGAMSNMLYSHGDEQTGMFSRAYEGASAFEILYWIPIVDNYSCVLMFRPTNDATLATLIEPIEDAQHNISTINIMNPDFDLSAVTVVHAFIYRDGFGNMCVIYAGYAEPSNN